ncbi:MAG: hypothetical protein Q8936_00695 [Bacillota bacterium]|nr:hypothetical protein [Bacillota bacterium]
MDINKQNQNKKKNKRRITILTLLLLLLLAISAGGSYSWKVKSIAFPVPPTPLNIKNGKINAQGVSANGGKWTYDIIAGTTANPDIVGVPMDGGSPSRAVIGGVITGSISNARPGDAFNLGTTASPFQISNTGNLTIKAQVAPNSASTSLPSLTAAGWKLYINGSLWDGSSTVTIATLAPGASTNLAVRLEYPTTSTVATQDLTTGSIDLNDLFTLTVTQENNPGWTQ